MEEQLLTVLKSIETFGFGWKFVINMICMPICIFLLIIDIIMRYIDRCKK